ACAARAADGARQRLYVLVVGPCPAGFRPVSPCMRRPWQIWLVYSICLAVALPAMAWLTHQTLEADKAEWHARLTAQREEIVSSVLWQMDTELTTLLAQEAARPHFVYSPSYAAPAVVLDSNDPTSPPTPASKG